MPRFFKCYGPSWDPDRIYRVSGVFLQCINCLLASKTVRTIDAGKSDWRNVAARAWNRMANDATAQPARAAGEDSP